MIQRRLARFRDDLRFWLGGGYVQDTNTWNRETGNPHAQKRRAAIATFIGHTEHLKKGRARSISERHYAIRFRYKTDLVLARMLSPPHLAPIEMITIPDRLRQHAKEAFIVGVLFPLFVVTFLAMSATDAMRDLWTKLLCPWRKLWP